MSSSWHLSNGILFLSVLLPGSEPKTTRFDSACRVDSICLNGTHLFAQREQVLPLRRQTGGVGLSSEWLCPWSEDAMPGGTFSKFGVGRLLQRPEGGPYDIWKPYDFSPFPVEYTARADSIRFLEHSDHAPLSAEIERTLYLQDNRVILDTRIVNTGTLAIHTAEYAHNFLAIDALPIGPGYHLDLPFDASLEHSAPWEFSSLDAQGRPSGPVPCMLSYQERAIEFTRPLQACALFKAIPESAIPDLPEYTWTLSHKDSPCRISETVSFKPCQCVLWGVEHVLSVEMFAPVHLSPGQSLRYSRVWTFEA